MWISYSFDTREVKRSCYKIWPTETLDYFMDGTGEVNYMVENLILTATDE